MILKYKGFTLIELLIVFAIIALLLCIVAPRYIQQTDRAKEVVLRENLFTIRNSIDQYYSDKGIYPLNLNELVDKKYLRKIPIDPITNSDSTWKLMWDENEKQKQVIDIKSGAEGRGKDGTEYSGW